MKTHLSPAILFLLLIHCLFLYSCEDKKDLSRDKAARIIKEKFKFPLTDSAQVEILCEKVTAVEKYEKDDRYAEEKKKNNEAKKKDFLDQVKKDYAKLIDEGYITIETTDSIGGSKSYFDHYKIKIKLTDKAKPLISDLKIKDNKYNKEYNFKIQAFKVDIVEVTGVMVNEQFKVANVDYKIVLSEFSPMFLAFDNYSKSRYKPSGDEMKGIKEGQKEKVEADRKIPFRLYDDGWRL